MGRQDTIKTKKTIERILNFRLRSGHTTADY